VPVRVGEALAAPACRGTVLARFPAAVYVALPRAFGVIAILARDAVRLPCGVRLVTSHLDLPAGEVLVGAGAIRIGGCEIRPGRVVSVRVARRRAPVRALVRRARRDVDRVVANERLLGRGEGLTPYGDDVLAGYLVAAAAYGLPAEELRAYVHRTADERTTTLSAALLRHAAAGETIPQVAGLLDALGGRGPLDPALAELRAVGHTSGAAMAAGVVAAAGMAA
jgi:hypothetical protein